MVGLGDTLGGMLLTAFPAGPLAANCYVVAAGPGRECVVIDTGQECAEPLEQVLAEHDLRVGAVLLTHGHFDHVWDAQVVADRHTAPVWVHPADRHLLTDPMAAMSTESAAMLRAQLGMSDLAPRPEPAQVQDAVDGAVIEVDGVRLVVDHCPGHTPGTVAYRMDYDGPEAVSQVWFTGDFLFAGSIGRTDLTGGDHDTMVHSLRERALPLADDVAVLPGHGPQSSIGQERATNPFLRQISDAS